MRSARSLVLVCIVSLCACARMPETNLEGGSWLGPSGTAPDAAASPGDAGVGVGTGGSDAGATLPDAAATLQDASANDPIAEGGWTQADAASGDATIALDRDATTSLPGDAASSDARSPEVPVCPVSSTLKPGKSSFTLQSGGVSRKFNLYVPRTYDGTTALPLVLDLHGLHEGADLHELFSQWDDRVDANQYVLAMPQGLDNAWNLGPCCTQSRTLNDVQFIRDLVAHVSAKGCIDRSRIYATGYSNGGGMSLRLACDAADLFASVAPAAFDLLEEMPCTPSRPISVFLFRGTDDPIVPYQGGPSTPPTLYSLPEIHFLGAQATFKRWSELNRCQGDPVRTEVGCMTYARCADGVKVTLCTREGGGHDVSEPGPAWPMLKEYRLP
jgi:polyhydroxybutyrate depolymerase